MGKKKNTNKTFRLPHNERTLVGSKVNTSSPFASSQVTALASNVNTLRLNNTNNKASVNSGSTASYTNNNNTTTASLLPSSPGPRVELDDDTLRKVLRYAGPLTLVSAARVCRSWRRVALEELYETRRLDLPGAMRRAGRSSIPTYNWVMRTIDTFPLLKTLSLAKFPHTDTYLPDIAAHVMHNLTHTTLETLDLSGLEFNADALYGLIKSKRLPALRQLILAGCDKLDGSHTSAVSNALKSAQLQLENIDLTWCARVNANELGCILTTGVIENARVARCENVRRICSEIPLSARTLNLHNCRNLGRFHVASGSLEELNLSQCVSLVSMHLSARNTTTNTSIRPHNLRVLNLASCTALRDVSVGVPVQPGQLEVFGFLRNIEQLLLSRTRSLQAGVFSRVFELAKDDICPMPKLKRLDLIGTHIQELRLQNYPELITVDASGCKDLNVAEIGECWKLEKVNLSCKNAPLARVNLHLPTKTHVLGVRKTWSWFNSESSQAISYGGV